MRIAEVRRLRLLVLGAAIGSVVMVELSRRYLDPGGLSALLWPLMLVTGVTLFTLFVFHRLEETTQNLSRQEQQAERLFTTAAVGMVLVGQGCRILRLNPAAERLTGFRNEELAGKAACSDLFLPAGDGQPICFSACLRQIVRQPNRELPALSLRTRDGAERSVAVSLAELAEGEFSLLFWDITERTKLERELARRRRQAESLYQVGREMAAITDLDRHLERLLEKARAVLEADVTCWGTLDEEGHLLTWQVAVGTQSAFAKSPLPLGESVTGRVLSAGRLYVTQSLASDLKAQEQAQALVLDEAIETAMAVPLQVRDRQYGVLFAGFRQKVLLTDEDLLLLSNLGSHLSIAVENSDLLARMQHLAALEERQRLARELHDSFGQLLTLIGMRLHLMEGMARDGATGDLLAEIMDLRAVLKDSHQEVRHSIYQLKESGPPLAPLWDRWEEHLRLFQQQTGIRVSMNGRAAVPAHLPERVEGQLTRVMQEALANVRNHSGAELVRVDADRDGHNLVLAIVDNGCGFEQEQARGPGEYHFGLSIMRERTESIGGRLEIRSEPGHGTTVRVTIPIAMAGGNDLVRNQSVAGR